MYIHGKEPREYVCLDWGQLIFFSFFIHSCFNYLIKHVYVTFTLERHYKPFIKSYWFVSVGSLPIELISHTLEGLRKKWIWSWKDGLAITRDTALAEDLSTKVG